MTGIKKEEKSITTINVIRSEHVRLQANNGARRQIGAGDLSALLLPWCRNTRDQLKKGVKAWLPFNYTCLYKVMPIQ